MKAKHDLTARELSVLQIMVTGQTDKQIAAELGISRRTTSNCVSMILLKLDATSRTEAVLIAIRFGLIAAALYQIQA